MSNKPVDELLKIVESRGNPYKINLREDGLRVYSYEFIKEFNVQPSIDYTQVSCEIIYWKYFLWSNKKGYKVLNRRRFFDGWKKFFKSYKKYVTNGVTEMGYYIINNGAFTINSQEEKDLLCQFMEMERAKVKAQQNRKRRKRRNKDQQVQKMVSILKNTQE